MTQDKAVHDEHGHMVLAWIAQCKDLETNETGPCGLHRTREGAIARATEHAQMMTRNGIPQIAIEPQSFIVWE